MFTLFHPHDAAGPCARNRLSICFVCLPERRQMHSRTARVSGPAAASGQTACRPAPDLRPPSSRAERLFLIPFGRYFQDTRMREMKLQDLKAKSAAELVSFAEELEVENASTM